ncbi:MAG: flagellar protein FlaG [Clostridia bacterium]|nr:flagellar protein FlaG [Clostridia bacterium]
MKDKEVSPEKVKSAVEDLNKQIRSTRCSFKYHEETNRISITVIDKDTDEVIKEIPPEKTLDMIAKAWELAGLMVDERR